MEKHGEKGLIPKPKGVSADPELRIKVVKAVIEQHMSLNQAAAHFMLAGSGSVARWLKVYEERGEAGLRALKIGTKRNIAISVDPEKAASALELSKDRRIEDLERQVRFLETRLMYLKKAESLSSSHEKVKVLNELRQFYPLDELLRAAEIPRSTFYYHLKALSKPDKYADVKKRISEIYHENRGRYGYRRVTLSLHREGKQINHKAVQRLMGTLSLKAAIKVKRYRSYRGEVGQTAPNVLQRDFKATRPNEKWVTDVTELQSMGASCICLQ